MASVPSAPARNWNRAFLALLLLEVAFLGGMAVCRRIPAYHDGFGYFGLQYYFLNSTVTGGEFPQWLPYMTQGTVANWWYAIQGNLLLNAAAFLGKATTALQPINFLPLFYAGIAFDMLMLLLGTWMLARRYFASAGTAFFTAAAVIGPCIWMDQPWFNFHFLYAIPLLLALVHRFLDRGSWWYLLGALNLLALQTIGNLPYFIPVTALVLFLYFGLYSLFNFRTVLDAVRGLRWGWPFLATVVLGAGGFAAAQLILQAGTEEIAYFNPGRGVDAKVQLDTFLSYGGEITRRKWAEMLLGVSPSLDNTLYLGMLAVPLLVAGCFFGLRRRTAHLPVLAGLLLLFGLGGFVSERAYHWWPLMGYYRHIGLTGCLTRLFLCFVAGCGFEAVFASREEGRWRGRAAGVFAAGMVLVAGGLFYLSRHSPLAERILTAMHTHAPTKLYAINPAFPVVFDPAVLSSRLFLSGCVALLAAALLAARWVVVTPHRRLAVMTAALLVSTGDVYLYKCGEARLRTAALPRSDLSLTAFQQMPYRPRRVDSFFAPNPRVDVFMRDLAFPGIRHWCTNPFAFVDEAGSSFRTDHWLRPLDRLLRTFAGQPITEATGPPPGCGGFGPMTFPLRSPAARKLGGVDADKVQFFRAAHLLRDETAISTLMADPRYQGDVLFVTAPPGDEGEQPDPGCLAGNDRAAVDYTVERFDSNNLEVVVNNPTGAPAWLLFSDVWHPGWRATVDGQRVFVHRAALAYKAVKVPAGQSRVHFAFHLRTVSVLYGVFAACSLLWLAVVAGLTVGVCRSNPPDCRAPAGASERSQDA